METEIDETSVPVSKLRDEILQLTATAGQAVDIMKDDNTFKSTYEQMTELAEVYPKLTDGQRAYLQYVIAGQRQGNIFSGMMANMTEGISAYETALNSANSAQREQEIFTNSIEGKLNEFKNSVTEIWVNSIDSDFIKNSVSSATWFIDALNNVIKTVGGLPTAIGVATASLVAFNSKIRENASSMLLTIPGYGKAITTMKGWSESLSIVSTKLQTHISDLKKQQVEALSSGNATSALGLKMLGLNGSLAVVKAGMVAVQIASTAMNAAISMGISVLISWGISALTKVVDNIITTKEELKEMRDEFLSNNDKAQEEISTLENLVSKHKQLQKELSNSALSDEEQKSKKEELLEVERQLASILPESATGFDEQGNKISQNTDAVQENIDKKKELATQEALDLIGEYDEAKWVKLINSYDEQKNKVDELQKAYDKLADGEKDPKLFANLQEEKSRLEAFGEEIKTASEVIKTFKKEGFSDDDISDLFFKNFYDAYTNGAERQEEGYKRLKEIIEEYTDSINENTKAKEKNNEVQPISKDFAFTQLQGELSKAEIALAPANEIMNEFTEAIEKGITPAQALADALNSIEMQSNLQEATSSYAKCIEEVGSLYDIMRELNEEQKLTPSIVAQVASAYPDVGASVSDLATLQDFLKSKIAEVTEQQLEAFEIMAGNDRQYYASKIANNEEFQQIINDSINSIVGMQNSGYEIDLANFTTLNDLKNGIQQQFGDNTAGFVNGFLSLFNAAYTFDSQNFATLNEMKQGYMNQLIPVIANWISEFCGKQADAYSSDLSNFNTLAEMKAYAISQLSQKMVELQAQWTEIIDGYNDRVQQAYASGNDARAEELEHLALKWAEPVREQMNAIDAQLSTIDKVFSGLEAQLNTYESKFTGATFGGNIKTDDASSKKKGDSSSKDKDIEDLKVKIDRYKDLNSQIQQITNEIEKNRALQETATGDQLAELVEQEKVLLEKQKQAYANLRDALKKEQNEIRNTLSQNGFTFDANGNITNYEAGLKKLEAWANESTGDEKERRKELVEDLSDQVDRYYDLINDEISDTDKTIINTSNEIYEIIMKQELEKIEAIKDASDAMFKAIEKKMNQLDYQQNVDGTANADKVNDYYVKKLGLIREQIAQAEKDLDNYNKELANAVTADAKAEALSNIADMEDALLDYKDTLQSVREEYQTWIIEMTQTPYTDKVWQLGTQQMNKIELELEIVGDSDYTKRTELMGKQLDIYNQLAEAAKKNYENLIYIRDNAELTADAEQELTQSLKDAEEQMHSANMELQQFREQYEKYLLEVMYKPYEDKMWQLGTQQMNKIEYKLEILDEDDTVGKMELLEEKLSLQQQMVDETNKYYQQLVYTRDNVELTADAYSELIQQMMDAEETMHDQAMSLQQLKKEMEDLAKDAIESYIDQLKELEELQMEQKHQEDINALGASFFKVSEEEYNKYKKIKTDSLNAEIESLKTKLALDSDNLALQQQLKGLQIELYDLQNENYADIQDWYELSERIHNANIEAIEKELEALEEAEELEKEREERLERQNELLEAQQKIEEIKRNKNIRQMKKDENGEWNFEYTYDEKELADANKDYQEKLEDLVKWEEELEKDKYKKKLEEQKKYEEEALNALKEMYEKQLEELEKKQEAEKEAMENKYDDMLANTGEYLEELKALYGDNWSEIMSVLADKLADGEKDLTKFKQHTIDEANEATNALNALMKYINQIDGTTITVFQKIETIDSTSSATSRMANIGTYSVAPRTVSGGDTNNYSIQASFPNATDSSEIEKALMNIDVIARQRVKTK